MNTQQKKALILFGMHRSGISVLAGCLNLLDVNFGKAIRPGNQANQTGFFENQDIVLQHDILLRDLGFRWDMVGSLPSDWIERKTVQDAREKISTLIEKNFSGEEYWAIKDPRLCRLMPLWMDVFKQTDIEPCFVLMVRHPFEVARSLEKRDGFDLLKGHLLWLMHNREALAACSGHKYVILTYDGLLADPVYSMENISRELGIVFPKEPKKVYQKLIDFVRPDLKHHNWGPQDKNENDIFAQYSWLYDQFRLIQARAIDTNTDGADISEVIPCEIMDQDLAISSFPLVTSGSSHSIKPEASHVSEMFNNLLNVISRYEQADLNRGIQRQRLLLTADQQGGALYAQIYFPAAEDDKDYMEENSQKILLAPDEWQQVALDIPRPEDLHTGRLRLDPLNTRGMVSVSSIKLIHAVTGETCWSAQDRDKFEQCSVEGDGFVLSLENGLNMVCTGNDARIRLPLIPHLPDCPLRLEVWIKANRNQTALHDIWMKFNRVNDKLTGDFEEKRDRLVQARKQVEDLEGQLAENTTALQAKEAERQEQDALRQTQIEKLQQEITDKNQSLAELEKRIKFQEELSGQYHSALVTAEQGLENIRLLNHENKQLTTWLRKLNNGFQALMASRRWKMGNAIGRIIGGILLRSKKPMVVDHIREIFTQFEKANQQAADYYTMPALGNQHDGERLLKWMKQLQDDFQALMASRRWRLGNAAFRSIEIMLFRRRMRLAPDYMKEIFTEFENWKQNVFEGRPISSLSYGDIKQLLAWMRKLNNNFQAMMASRRWRVGNAMVRFVKSLLFRSRKPMVTDHMQKIFEDYRNVFQR